MHNVAVRQRIVDRVSARPGRWHSFDRLEPPLGSGTDCVRIGHSGLVCASATSRPASSRFDYSNSSRVQDARALEFRLDSAISRC